MKLINDLNWRYAVKQFSDVKVEQAQLRLLLEATRLSASSYGLQPYKILVISSKDIRQQLLPFSYGQDKVAECSHLIIFAADNKVGDLTVDRYINKHAQTLGVKVDTLSRYADHMKSALANKTKQQKQEWAQQQAYIALGNFLTCAAHLKIDSCPMTGFDNAGFDQVLGLQQKGLTSSVICPIGYRHPDDVRAHEPKVRFDYQDIVMEM